VRGAAATRTDPLELFANTTDGVMAVDPSGRIILWNHAAEALVGYAAAEVLGRRCYEILGGRDDHGNVLCHLNCHVLTMAKHSEPAHAYDLMTHVKDGTERWLNVSTVLVPAPGGHIVVHLFRDVTGTRQPQHLMQALLDRLGSSAAPSPPTAQVPSLTPREREILRLLASGEDTQAIARRLFITTATVRNHTQNILTKLDVHSRLEAVALAFRSQLI
jgi:PAS domain S-box-containing protein